MSLNRLTRRHPEVDGWHTVVRNVSENGVVIWFGTLKGGESQPESGRIRYRSKEGDWQENCLAENWHRCLPQLDDRFYQLFTLNDLTPNTEYEWELWLDTNGKGPACYGHAEFKTLPTSIQGADDPFTLMLGSCFHEAGDDGQVERTYRALWETAGAASPNLTFLAGDQVYLDVGLGPILALGKKGIARHIGNTYHRHWRGFGSVLNKGATWMLADDHELWNGYPLLAWYNPYLIRFHWRRFRTVWEQAAREAAAHIQGCQEARFLSVGNDLEIMTLDTRLARTTGRFLNDTVLEQAVGWIQGLSAPGVLVLTQSLTDPPRRIGGRKLVTYSEQYLALCQAILEAEHDLVLLCGDVHYGRVAEGRNLKGRRVIEVIASPLSNVRGPASLLALNTVPAKPIRLPAGQPPDSTSITLQQCQFVPWENGFLSGYLRRRTQEHFQTLSFYRDKELHLTIKAWKVRGSREGGPPECFNWVDAHWKLE